MCVKQTVCKACPSRGVWGHAPPPPHTVVVVFKPLRTILEWEEVQTTLPCTVGSEEGLGMMLLHVKTVYRLPIDNVCLQKLAGTSPEWIIISLSNL